MHIISRLLVLGLLTSCGSPSVPIATQGLATTVASSTLPSAPATPASNQASTPVPATVAPSTEEAPTLVLSTATPASGEAPPSAQAIATPAATANATPIVITIQNADDQPGFVIDCPLYEGCDETFDYRAYRYEDAQVFLYLSFDPAVASPSTYDELIEHYRYVNLEVRFPERTSATSRFYYTNQSPIRQLMTPSEDGVTVELFEYEAQRLRGRISGTVTSITEFRTSNDPACRLGDVGGMCIFNDPTSIPFVITFDLSLRHDGPGSRE